MGTENVVLMKMARKSLQGKWGPAIGFSLLFLLTVGGLQAPAKYHPLSEIVWFIFAGPLLLGMVTYFLTISRDHEGRLEQLFSGFFNFKTAMITYLLVFVYVLLWTLLLIIPGIIAAITYSMTFYIIADDSSIGPNEAIDKSKKMMDGFKWKFFCLSLRFLGLAILCLFTLGIGFLWLFPYMQVTIAKFYDDVRSDFSKREGLYNMTVIS